MTNMSLTCGHPPSLPTAAFASRLARSLTEGGRQLSQNGKYKEVDRGEFIVKPVGDNTEVVELDKDKGGVGGARAGGED